MIDPYKKNPFHILGVAADAATEAIVQRGQERCELAVTEQDTLLFRWAMEELIKNPNIRLVYELFEIPQTNYDNRDWEVFINQHERCPVNVKRLTLDYPPLTIDDIDLGVLCRFMMDDMLNMEKPDLTPLIQQSPFKPDLGLPPLEVRDVIFG